MNRGSASVPPPATTGSSPRAAGVRAVRAIAGALVDAVLPQTCVACGRAIPTGSGLACHDCHDQITAAADHPYCPRCGRTMPPPAIHEKYCARCRTEPYWNLKAVARVAPYTPALRSALLGLKYAGQARNARFLGRLLAETLRGCDWGGTIDLLVPVPMSWRRRLQRPCDHARLLAEALGREMRRPVVAAVARSIDTPTQVDMVTKTERLANVKGCFAPARWARLRPDRLRGKAVCIVDNLILSGGTVCEVAKVLRRAGAKPIYALTVARGPAPGDPLAGLPAVDYSSVSDAARSRASSFMR